MTTIKPELDPRFDDQSQQGERDKPPTEIDLSAGGPTGQQCRIPHRGPRERHCDNAGVIEYAVAPDAAPSIFLKKLLKLSHKIGSR
ncbi:hypothetical protein RvVAT039_pl05840 (plasmid) [Agrobacterium vitis]|nr:hypothetical protein RvVAT039_pl05840 [Agrobacterium vitis]